MQEVKIAELKARLSHYLHLVEAGEEILVKDRERPVARLIGCRPATVTDFGVPRRVSREEAADILSKIPRPKLSRQVIEESLGWMKRDRSARWGPKKRGK